VPPAREEDADVLESFRRYRASGDRRLRNELIERHRWIAIQCARRFDRRGEPLDDLVQIAQIGVLKAVERFDPAVGVAFPSFAMPTVMGELRRHFRDATWTMRVPRRLKELHVALAGANEALVQRLGRQPKVEELAAELSVDVDDILEALDAGANYRAAPLTAPAGDDGERTSEPAAMGMEDPDLARAEVRMAIRRLLSTLATRERTIVYLRYFRGLTQQEIADRVGTSQVHVSRLLRASLARLREELGEDEPAGDAH
jgi:RNA polymerase sigma-B factor